jgi:plasmid stabilization system protein ParE
MTVVTSPMALEDVDAAAVRLNRERAGHGDALNDLFAEAVREIGRMPRRFPRAEDSPPGVECREAFIERFEYRVIFSFASAEMVEVLAVVHARRKPASWHRRLSELN